MLSPPAPVTVAVHGVIGEPVYTNVPGEQLIAVVDDAGVTFWPPANVPLLVLKLTVPEYVATTECGLVGTSSVAVEHVAMPETTGTAVHAGLPSITKLTVPLLPTEGTEDTVAVNVTMEPNTDGFIDELTAVVVAAALTVWVPFDEVEHTNVPLY